jgi:hypothetical protein
MRQFGDDLPEPAQTSPSDRADRRRRYPLLFRNLPIACRRIVQLESPDHASAPRFKLNHRTAEDEQIVITLNSVFRFRLTNGGRRMELLSRPPTADNLQRLIPRDAREPGDQLSGLAQSIEALKCDQSYPLQHVLGFLPGTPDSQSHGFDNWSIAGPQLCPRLLVASHAQGHELPIMVPRSLGVIHQSCHLPSPAVPSTFLLSRARSRRC